MHVRARYSNKIEFNITDAQVAKLTAQQKTELEIQDPSSKDWYRPFRFFDDGGEDLVMSD